MAILNTVDLGIMRCFQAGSSAVGILRAMTNHLLQLEAAGVRIQSGEDAGAVLKSLRPPIFSNWSGGSADNSRFGGDRRSRVPCSLRSMQN